jgi:uncharacterized membrane protein YbaN (DUF454 family)
MSGECMPSRVDQGVDPEMTDLHTESGRSGRSKNRAVRWCLTAAGLFSIGLAVLGIFLPLLPTVPLLLLAAACFARSSERFHRHLLEHRRLGPLIRPYLAGAGIPRKAKASAIILIWLTIPASALYIVPLFWVKALLIGIAAAVTIYLLLLPTLDPAAPRSCDP